MRICTARIAAWLIWSYALSMSSAIAPIAHLWLVAFECRNLGCVRARSSPSALELSPVDEPSA